MTANPEPVVIDIAKALHRSWCDWNAEEVGHPCSYGAWDYEVALRAVEEATTGAALRYNRNAE